MKPGAVHNLANPDCLNSIVTVTGGRSNILKHLPVTAESHSYVVMEEIKEDTRFVLSP